MGSKDPCGLVNALTFCPQCGKPVAATDSFCTACGTQVVHAETPAAIAPAQVAPTRRPPGVTIIGGTMIVVGAFFVFGFLGGLYAPTFDPQAWNELMRQSSEQIGRPAEEIEPVLRGMLVGGAIVAALAIVAGIGSLLRKRWAWSLMLAFMGLNALLAILLLPGSLAFGILGLAASALVIWYFLRPEVKAYFGRV